MSIAIVALTGNYAVVATDSKMVGDRAGELCHKLQVIKNDMVIFGTGNAGLVKAFIDTIAKDKERYQNYSFEDMLAVMDSFDEWIRKDYAHVNIFCAIGVCDGSKYHVRVVESSPDYPPNPFIVEGKTSDEKLHFYILPPADLSPDFCNALFRQNCRGISRPSSLHTLVSPCLKTIRMVSHISKSVGEPIDYWAYDRHTGECEVQFFDS